MKCAHPQLAVRDIKGNYHMVGPATPGLPQRYKLGSDHILLPCGQCINCRLTKALTWAVRCTHEELISGDGIFLTLTYADEPGSIIPEDFTLFIRRLRHFLPLNHFRYFACAEYGEQYDRPHFHAIIWGLKGQLSPSEVKYKKSRSGGQLYNSPIIDQLWGKGYSPYSKFSTAAAGYIARYSMKKIIDVIPGSSVKNYYFTTSRNPGIGMPYVDRYLSQILQTGRVYFPNSKSGDFPCPEAYYRYILKRYPTLEPDVEKIRDLSLGSLLDATAEDLADDFVTLLDKSNRYDQFSANKLNNANNMVRSLPDLLIS